MRATFRIPEDFPQVPLWWSAVPVDEHLSPEAWAPIDEMVVATGEFEPGRYEVSALAPGETEFMAIVEIRTGEANDYVIALADQRPSESDGDGLFEGAAFVCTGHPAGCTYSDPGTGLSLRVPEGWSITQPAFYRTAAGMEAAEPGARLFRQHEGVFQVLELNPRQWLDSNGPCIDIERSRLCHEHSPDAALADAVATVRASMQIAERPSR